MSAERVISARVAHRKRVDAFPYYAADLTPSILPDAPEDDQPVGANLSTPEEDAQRLASVDQIVFNKLQDAEREAHDIARRAYEEGFASGEAEGRTFGESQYKVIIQQLETHFREFSRLGDLLGRAAADETVALALAMGEYLAVQQIEAQPASIRPLLDRVLSANPFPGTAEGEAMLVACMNPKDRESLGRDFQVPGVALQEDPAMTRGSLRLEAPDGVLDATFERRRDRLMEYMKTLKEKATP